MSCTVNSVSKWANIDPKLASVTATPTSPKAMIYVTVALSGTTGVSNVDILFVKIMRLIEY